MRTSQSLLALGGLLLIAACGDDGTQPPAPLTVTAMTPAAQASNVETGTAVSAVFSGAIDPATLTASTFTVKRDGTPLGAKLTYDAGTRTAIAAVPLLPGVTYDAEITTGVRTPGGMPLAAGVTRSFATRTWQGATADMVEFGGWTLSLALDATGRLHVSHYDLLNADLRYATCAADCLTGANWNPVTVDATGDRGAFNALVVSPDGQVHVVYYDATNDDLRYATCASGCATAGNWQTGIAGDAGGSHASLVRDASGRLHVTYYDPVADDLRYGTCGGSCHLTENWEAVTVDAAGDVGEHTSLAIDGAGRLHVSYYAATPAVDLKYATCGGACTVTANWQTIPVESAGDVGFSTSIAVQGTQVHVVHHDIGNSDLRYAACSASCGVTANWQSVSVDAADDVGANPAVALDTRGRLHVTYYDNGNNDLKYATCATACEQTGSWQITFPDADASGGMFSALMVDGTGRLHVVYSENTMTWLRYVE